MKRRQPGSLLVFIGNPPTVAAVQWKHQQTKAIISIVINTVGPTAKTESPQISQRPEPAN